MSTEILRQIDTPEWESKIDLVRRTVAAGASDDELGLFFHQARRTGLDPLARQIYFVKRQGKGTIQVGIDGYRLIAHRSGECGGIEDAELGPVNERGYPSWAKVTVWRFVQGQRCPFAATARWDEYYPGDQQGFQWKKMPAVMLSKCAEALALRKAFPAELSGMYVDAEMDQADRQQSPPEQPRPVSSAPVADGEPWLRSMGFNDAEVDAYNADCVTRGIDPLDMAKEARAAGCKTGPDLAAYVQDGIAPASFTDVPA